MRLDVDGILHVTAIEKETGKSKHVTIARALREKSPAEIAAAQERLKTLYSVRAAEGPEIDENEFPPEADGQSIDLVSETRDQATGNPPISPESVEEAQNLVEQSQGVLGKLHTEDREEAIELHERIHTAITSNDGRALKQATADLRELLFFVEGR
jgi:molecular chaperone DnaK (HSP70)